MARDAARRLHECCAPDDDNRVASGRHGNVALKNHAADGAGSGNTTNECEGGGPHCNGDSTHLTSLIAIAEIAVLFPPDADEAAEVLERCSPGKGVVAEEKLFDAGVGGQPRALGARRQGELVGVAVTAGPWLRLIAVQPDARGIGIGSALLVAALDDISQRNVQRIRLAAEPGNYYEPGIDVADESSIAWFERRGFERGPLNINLIVDVSKNARVTDERRRELAARSAERGYVVSKATASDREPLIALAESMGAAWSLEIKRALMGRPGAVHIARDSTGSLVAFAAHDGNNCGLGWFGPAATLEAHRGKGLGETLLVACLVDIAKAGHAVAEIAWIGPREFYERAVGVTGERQFVTMEKTTAETGR